jgi:outer membrane protein assembly factor BamA
LVLSLLLSVFLFFNLPGSPPVNAFYADSGLPKNSLNQPFFLGLTFPESDSSLLKNSLKRPFFSSHAFPDSALNISSDSSLVKNCPKQAIFIKQIVFEGNNKTKEKVLRAELGFTEGAVLDSATLAEETEASRIRLFNLQLFHWVKSEISCDNGEASVKFIFQERWYFFPVPIFSLADRNINAWLKKKDFNRIDYGLHVVQQNVRGRNETLRSNLQHGFNRKYELFYQIPYISRRQKLGLSVGASHYQSHYVDFTTTSDTLNTYRNNDHFPIQRTYFAVNLFRRENVQRQWNLGLSWHQEQISDSVFIRNPAYFSGQTNRTFLDLELTRIINLRNTFAYPLSGSYFQAGVSYRYFLHDQLRPLATVLVKFSKYYELPQNFYYSIGLEGQTRLSKKVAYADNIALGYKSYVRGYEQNYVIGGQHYGLLKQGFSKRAFSEELNVKFIRNPKFNKIPIAVYSSIFADGAYVTDTEFARTNRLTNRFLGSAGIGLHLVTYYDKVVTLELSRNREGENGFLIHTSFPF